VSDRLSRSHVLVIGFVILAAIAAGAVFGFVRPTAVKAADMRKQRDAERGEAAKLPMSQQQLVTAQQSLADTKEKFKGMFAKMPSIRMGGDRIDAMEDLWQIFGRTLGDEIVREFTSRGARITALTMPTPPSAPPAPVDVIRIEEPSFGVQVRGGFPSVLKLLTSMKNMNRLMGIRSVDVSGVSPNLRVNMPGVIFLVTDQVEKNPGAAPAAPGAPGAPTPAPAAPPAAPAAPSPTPGFDPSYTGGE